jgi:hypothetical protein
MRMSVTIHDVAPATQARCERLIACIERTGAMPLTLLIVPYYHRQPSTRAFEQWVEMRLNRGDELALHGLTHLDDEVPVGSWLDVLRRRLYTAGEGEFAALDHSAAEERLEAGRRWFGVRDWPLRGFVAPAWLLSRGSWSALRAQPFDYTCTLTRLVALPSGARTERIVQGRSIVFSTRAAWRRRASLAWNSALVARQRHARWMRFELHPDDVEHESVRAAVGRWLSDARCTGHEPLTLGQLVDLLPDAGGVSLS